MGTLTPKARTSSFLATALLAAALSCHAHAQCQYEVTIIQSDLDCGPFGDPITIPTGMNELGHVVGYHYCLLPETAVPFLWTPALGFVSLGLPPGASSAQAEDVNEDLQIVGSMDPPGPSGQHGFVWQNREWITLLPEGDGIFSGAYANNRVGQVVGYRDHDIGMGYMRYGFLWQNGAFTDIVPTYGPESIARGVNEAAEVVGWMGPGIGIDSHAFLWETGRVTDLGLPRNTISASANAINNSGQIAIGAKFEPDHPADLISGGILWEDGQWTNLGMLPGYDSMAVTDLNDSATVVGWCRAINSGNAPDAAFIWRAGMMTNLNDLIPADPRITIQRAEAITNGGQIITRASRPGVGVVAALLTPIEGPLGDLNADCTVGIFDLLTLLSSWGPCPPKVECPGDLNSDGAIGILDLLILLANWG